MQEAPIEILVVLRKIKHVAQRIVIGFPKTVQCNICHWDGRRFTSDDWHPYTICPRCGSQVRHRLLAAALSGLGPPALCGIAKGKDVLHFAPEPVLAGAFAGDASRYRTADLLRQEVDLNLNMCDMKEIPDGSVDVLIACDVLEHVPDDHQALNEVSRVLSSGGWAILTVPQKDRLPATYEDPAITTEEGRLEAFGQEDHLRIYGDNFPEILVQHGFAVTTVSEKSFTEDLVKRLVLFPPVLSAHPLATNYRKVFFAQKPMRT